MRTFEGFAFVREVNPRQLHWVFSVYTRIIFYCCYFKSDLRLLLLSRMAPFVCLATAYILQQCYCKWLRNNYDSLFVATVTLMFTDGSKITR